MKRKSWQTAAIIFGIAVLSAAVALMPACDLTDSACETLEGTWEVNFTEKADPCNLNLENPDYVDFKVYPQDGMVYMEWRDELSSEPPLNMSGTINCDGDDFTVFCTGQPENVGPDCTLTRGVVIHGTFNGNSHFDGIWDFSEDYEGTCTPVSCLSTYDISAVRR